MEEHRPPPPFAVDISSSESEFSPSPPRFLRRHVAGAGAGAGAGGGAPPLVVCCDDHPSPQKPEPSSNLTTAFVPETPLSQLGARAKCTFAPSEKISSGLICLESDDESGAISCKRKSLSGFQNSGFGLSDNGTKLVIPETNDSERAAGIETEHCKRGGLICLESDDESEIIPCKRKSLSVFGNSGFELSENGTQLLNPETNNPESEASIETGHYKSGKTLEGMAANDVEKGLLNHGLPTECLSSYSCEIRQVEDSLVQKGKRLAAGGDNIVAAIEGAMKKRTKKEERAQMVGEKKRKKLQEKIQEKALKDELKEIKKLEKEKQKWKNGKYAIKCIVAELDVKIIENGSIGGHLLSRFADKGLSYRVSSNPIEKSVLWTMSLPDEIAQISSSPQVVSYILLIYQAEEFCMLVSNGSLLDHVRRVQNLYPAFIICYLINKLSSYLHKCEQQHFKSQSSSCWKRPPVEEVLSILATHFTKVHSRLCVDEAELAEHVVGLTCSLASCMFRKKPTWLSTNGNGLFIPKSSIDKDLIKKSPWLKALISIPKVQPRFAIAIAKKYPTMRSLLDVYMDHTKSVHEKEFLLKDLMVDGVLKEESRRLGEVCSKRIYRIIMAPRGDIVTEDVEDGAGFFIH